MSLWKVIVIVSACTLLLFIGILLYALYPTIRNVSNHPGLRPYIDQQLTLKRDVFAGRFKDHHRKIQDLPAIHG
jgi:hypothetical protein